MNFSIDKETSSLVCVTGGTGFIASSLIRRLLLEGYTVRATVRNPQESQKTAFLWKLEGAKERLSIVGADLMQDGSFDAAMKDVVGVFHTACPVLPPFTGQGDPQELMIDPSVKGTLNVLRACVKSTTMKRVVMTSSCSAIRYDNHPATAHAPLDETIWSNTDFCKKHQMWYALSKTLAEQEAWKFAHEHNLDLVVVNPSYVLGPFLGDSPSSTVAFILYFISGKAKEFPNQIIGFVHVDDVVAAHILAYEKAEAHGRYICSSDVVHWEKILNTIGSKFSTAKIPKRCRGDGKDAVPHTLSTSKIQQLGLTAFKNIDTMLDDCVQDLISKGLLPQI